jgi:hypothetical protein
MKDRMVLVTAAAGNAAAFQIGLRIGLDRGLPRLCQRHRPSTVTTPEHAQSTIFLGEPL